MAACLRLTANVDYCVSGGDCYCAGIIDHLLMTVVYPKSLSSARTELLTCRTRVGVVERDLCLVETHPPSFDDAANDAVDCVDDENSLWLFVQALKLLSMNLFCSSPMLKTACSTFHCSLCHGR